jgi:Ca2+-binding RTX toxin-like protein
MKSFDSVTGDLDFLKDSRPAQLDDAWTTPFAAGQRAVLDGTDDNPARAGIAAAHQSEALTPYAVQAHGAANIEAAHRETAAALSFAQPHQTEGTSAPADTSPGMSAEEAYVSGVDTSGHVAATSFWTWNSNTPATYASSSDAHKWGLPASGTAGGTVDFYFDPASNWTATEKSQMTACLTLWSDIANIHFALTTNAADAQITFHRGDDGQADTPAGWSGGSSAGDVGGSTLWTMTSATVSIDTSVPGFGPMDGNFASIGGYVWMTIEHEMGHAIGLGHGGAYNGTVDSATQQFSAYDTRLWTIMSYIDADDTSAKYYAQYPVTGTSWGTAPDGYAYVPTTPMILDDLAIQQLYGASTSAAFSGGQTFGFNCNITDVTKEFYDFTVNKHPVVTIWDAGTGNTLDLSGFTKGATINLNPGTFSSANGEVNNIGIAFGTHIDTADGTNTGDTFIANGDDDTLEGKGGNDVFDFGATLTANDHINGGAGTNSIYLDGDYSAGLNFRGSTFELIQRIVLTAGFSYSLAPSDDNVAAGATLTIDGHSLKATDVMKINGVKELNGNFIILGGSASDTLTGGSGNDTITGGLGSDVLKGGPGSDTFVYTRVQESTSVNHDSIVDFDASADKIKLWFAVAGVSTAINGGTLSTGSFNSGLAAATASLPAHHAVLFTPSAGNLAGHTFLVVDVNGTAGYQQNLDLVIDLGHPANAASFGMSDFITS